MNYWKVNYSNPSYSKSAFESNKPFTLENIELLLSLFFTETLSSTGHQLLLTYPTTDCLV